MDSLDSLDLRLQLLIDEMDQMYKIDGKEFPSVVTTLNDLIYFANQPSGRMSIMICGSSALMEDLITTNAPESVAKKFVLLSTGATNLNDNKFVTKRVYSSMPCDLQSVASITGEIFTDENKPWLRLVAFCTGCTARNVGRILKEADTLNAIDGLACPENSLSGGGTLNNKELYLPWHAIMKKLTRKNSKLMEELLSSSHHDLNDGNSSTTIITAISSSNWEETFVPLTFIDVEDKWRKLHRQKKISDEMFSNLSYNILHLADRNWIAFDGVKHSRPDRIYPFALLSLCNYYVELKRDIRYAEQLRRKIAEGLRFAREPRVIAVAEIRSVTVAAAVVTTATIPLYYYCSCSIM